MMYSQAHLQCHESHCAQLRSCAKASSLCNGVPKLDLGCHYQNSYVKVKFALKLEQFAAGYLLKRLCGDERMMVFSSKS
eukprot:5469646-Amphidinium_carterae.1